VSNLSNSGTVTVANNIIGSSSQQRHTSSLARGSISNATAHEDGMPFLTAILSAISRILCKILGARLRARCRVVVREEGTALFEIWKAGRVF